MSQEPHNWLGPKSGCSGLRAQCSVIPPPSERTVAAQLSAIDLAPDSPAPWAPRKPVGEANPTRCALGPIGRGFIRSGVQPRPRTHWILVASHLLVRLTHPIERSQSA